ncbi:glycerophosphodiester phosphodiesterase [Enterococcus saccharolyticus]|uniref:Glycerophosphodiester phosphodiesterase n=1 Tax=Candidatus Enterococcus willemsii TaxID=1857215 RepID=A0ABQ6YYV5_9ENTE|nr:MULTISPECIES: glycerophosphodiester phosphodiesterase [Enterococcus]KAF1303319.1 glycerophosphodiester phosphodiesterase [Enterococcus sp. CU12B]MCD5001710.1 glycerophosphodiester phosphodiesterase [Enterococcus saccharolyticus]
MNYLRHSFINARDFLKGTKDYFKNVLLMHGFMLFLLIPILSNATKFILHRGNIRYISFDNLGDIVLHHPWVSFFLFIILLGIVLAVFFEFTFLLLSVYFIKKEQPVRLRQLLRMTIQQMRKIRIETVLFFFFYFFLVLPIGSFSFQSDLLSKVKIPAFILDFIFENRLIIISSFILFYLLMIYLGIRFIFALPEMILRDRPFRLAVKESWYLTKKRFFAIIAQLFIITGTALTLTSLSFVIVIGTQTLVEHFLSDYALTSAVFAMTLLQFFLLIQIVLSTIAIFYVIVDFMDDEGFLPPIPTWFSDEKSVAKYTGFIQSLLVITAIFFGVGVSLYNRNYLTDASSKIPITASHRGVSNANGVQNSIAALEKTTQQFHPKYVEMDVQQTKDDVFIVYHDFNFKSLTGVNLKPEQATLAEVKKLTISENGQTSPVPTFDDYLDVADQLNQNLLIEIKTQQKDIQALVTAFLQKYRLRLEKQGHILQSLSFDVVEEIKQQAPELTAGYILPFNLVGPPITEADFLTMEYSTLNRNFINSAHRDGKQVFVWTPNDEDTMDRMMFYGVDGIITDQMGILNAAITHQDEMTYSDKLFNFVIGIG